MPPVKISSSEIIQLALRTLNENRVAIFIVAYNAERHIKKLFDRIPDWIVEKLTEIFVIDDSSKDSTVEKVVSIKWSKSAIPLRVFKTPYNQGYGGNQRLGYSYAIARKFDIVVLLHADGQYAPEFLPEILAEYSRVSETHAVYGSRFLTKGGALKGKMPLYKFFGNRILTYIQNKILGTRMSEMHSGYRSYRVSALKKIPFQSNSLGFDFDSDIIIQFVAAGLTIREVSIPTFYGDEICRVDGLKYAWKCLKGSCQYRLMQFEIFYTPKFDLINRKRKYTNKVSPTSLHSFIRQLPLSVGSQLLDLGGGDGSAVAIAHADRGVNTTVVDQLTLIDDIEGERTVNHPYLYHVNVNLDSEWNPTIGDLRFHTVFALDILEHMKFPERTVEQIFSVMRPGGKLYASTGNISYWIIRAIHLLGHFNYGRRGILDLTHTRLFTISSFRSLLQNAGFQINSIKCFGPPIADLAGGKSNVFLRILDRISASLAQIWKGFFGYQVLIEATRPDSLEELMSKTFVDYCQIEKESKLVIKQKPIEEDACYSNTHKN